MPFLQDPDGGYVGQDLAQREPPRSGVFINYRCEDTV